MNNIIKEWNETTSFKMFEIEVVNISTAQKDYVIFNISLDEKNKCLIAEHEALNKEQDRSDKVAYESVDVDVDHTLSGNLEGLLDECTHAILNSTYFKLV